MSQLAEHRFPALADNFGRKITYLRLSVTDRCDLRCFYCMPQADFNRLPHGDILRFEEILQIVKVLAGLGVRKIRFTGGEPLIRRDVVKLIRCVSHIPGVEELCMTTNGVRLSGLAEQLFEAGVRHINISLDTLKPARFLEITGRDLFDKVWSGIKRCLDIGFPSVKINFVMMRGKNDDEIIDFVRLAQRLPVEVRFIEFMPVGSGSNWGRRYFLPSDQVIERIEDRIGRLMRIPTGISAGPAELFETEGVPARIGFISPLSRRFCSECNRIRITADGRLRLCLFSDREIGLRNTLRNGMTDSDLARFFLDAVREKPAGYIIKDRDAPTCVRQMSSIGG
jgi:cyclic pyranopterin phosphate synthase